MIKLNGSYCEGGGAIVRTALALSTITRKPFEVTNIRKGRSKPGLKNQHLFCIESLQKLCDAEIHGAKLGSTDLKFIPKKVKVKNLNIDIKTAGSITLLLQSLILPCFFMNKKINLQITGGTDTKWSMPIDYLKEIFVPQIRKFCENIDVNLMRRGYYPKGKGNVIIDIRPKPNFEEVGNSINLLEQHHLMHIKGVSHASFDLQKANVAERQAKAAKLTLNKLGCPINIDVQYSNSASPGSGITLWAIFSKHKDDIDIRNPIRLGSDSLGQKGKKAEIIGKEAADRLIKEISYGAPVDEYLADNLIIWLALFKGKIKASKITNHTLTNIYVVEQFLGKTFNIDGTTISTI